MQIGKEKNINAETPITSVSAKLLGSKHKDPLNFGGLEGPMKCIVQISKATVKDMDNTTAVTRNETLLIPHRIVR